MSQLKQNLASNTITVMGSVRPLFQAAQVAVVGTVVIIITR